MNEDESARNEREKRRRKVLVEQQRAHEAQEVEYRACWQCSRNAILIGIPWNALSKSYTLSLIKYASEFRNNASWDTLMDAHFSHSCSYMIVNFSGAYKEHANIAPMRFEQDISISNADISNTEMTLPSSIDTAYLLFPTQIGYRLMFSSIERYINNNSWQNVGTSEKNGCIHCTFHW